jgi:hypothetical protein
LGGLQGLAGGGKGSVLQPGLDWSSAVTLGIGLLLLLTAALLRLADSRSWGIRLKPPLFREVLRISAISCRKIRGIRELYLILWVHILPVTDPDHQDDQAVVFHPVDDPIEAHPEAQQTFPSFYGHGASGPGILGQ